MFSSIETKITLVILDKRLNFNIAYNIQPKIMNLLYVTNLRYTTYCMIRLVYILQYNFLFYEIINY